MGLVTDKLLCAPHRTRKLRKSAPGGWHARNPLACKVQSQQGASILLALAVVLVCAMVAAVVLVSAAANVGKTPSAQKGNAAYYTVSSAAQMLADDLAADNPHADIATHVKTYACQEAHPTYVHEDAGVVSQTDMIFISTSGAATPFIQMVEEALHAIDPTDEGSVFTKDFTIAAPDLDSVSAHMEMDAAYNITVELRTESADSYGYALTLHIASVRSEPAETTSSETIDSHMDGWTYTDEALSIPWRETTTLNLATGTYEPESNEFGHSTEQLYEITTTTTTTTVSWGQAVITKGVAGE